MPQALLLKALIRGCLFYCLLLSLLYPLAAPAAPLCPAQHIDREVVVRYVHDGDTLHLTSGEKVRLIGVDTPELARKSRPNQAFAVQARDRLRQLVRNSSNKLALRLDTEHLDRYGRRLAHLYTQNGSSIAAQLLQEGLATLLAIPPNLNGLDCYAKIETQAQKTQRGVWQLPLYQAIHSTELPRNARDYRRVYGEVVRIGEGRHNLWINLVGQVAFRIQKNELHLFNALKPRELLGKTITARGRLYEHRGELRMRLRSPYALSIHPE